VGLRWIPSRERFFMLNEPILVVKCASVARAFLHARRADPCRAACAALLAGWADPVARAFLHARRADPGNVRRACERTVDRIGITGLIAAA
jgi:hypothetical protein